MTSEERYAGIHPAYPLRPLGERWRRAYRGTARRLLVSLGVYVAAMVAGIAGAWRALGLW
ncbi:hypothetical protein Kisp02_55140 [Kineosporia sp. NBRC 101731]|nr:hypothetical protein Kisp02_55140 [Kineosporia sp. NBRC 101731]